MEKYRGDTFAFNLTIEDESGKMNFEIGDIVRIGIKKYIAETTYSLFKEINVEAEVDNINIVFNSDETKKLEPRNYQMEVELTRNGVVSTIYRDELKVIGDVIHE